MSAGDRQATEWAGGEPRVMHVITSLGVGGAEMMLLKLLAADAGLRSGAAVVALSGEGEIAAAIRRLGVPVTCLGMSRMDLRPRPWSQLVGSLRAFSPDIVQGWLYHGNWAALAGTRCAGMSIPVVWGVRQSCKLRLERPATLGILGTLVLLSRFPQHILYNSQRGARSHQRLGFSHHSWSVIPNGFDTTVLRPQPEARSWLRQELGIDPQTMVIGMFGRYTPWKGHANFLQAANIARAQAPRVHYVLAGSGVEPSNRALTAQLEDLGLQSRVSCLGLRADVPRLMAGLDIATSCSLEEGFPNAVGEAMATGLPCVVTNAGDSALILGDCGLVVRPGDAAALAEAWLECVRRGPAWRRETGERARRRIAQEFSLAGAAAQHRDLYRDLVAGRPPGRGVAAAGRRPPGN